MQTTPNYAIPYAEGTDARRNYPASVDGPAATIIDTELARVDVGTGLRDVTGELINGWSAFAPAGVSIARVGNLVTVNVYGLNGSAATGNTFWNLPEGFREGRANYIITAAIFQAGSPITNASMTVDDGSGLSTAARDTSMRASVTYYCDDGWPTVLPGTPA
jgi:hypothetical protein